MNYQKLKSSLFLFIILTLGCMENKTPTEPGDAPLDLHRFIRGRVFLENQTDHGSCPVVLDSLTLGTLTDSTGYYEIVIPDSLCGISGKFNLYSHLYDYGLDTLVVELDSGRVVWGKEDVLEDGTMRNMMMEQLLSLTITAGKEEYLINEEIDLHYTLHNKSSLWICISSPQTYSIGFYDMSSHEDEWRRIGQDPTGDFVIIYPDTGWHHHVVTTRDKSGTGYYMLDHGIFFMLNFYEYFYYRLPASMVEYLNDLRSKSEDMVFSYDNFLVFFNHSKNLHFPLVNIVQEE